MTSNLIQQMLEPKFFDAFVQENMKNSTYVAEWKKEVGNVEPCSAKAYKARLAEYTAATIGSVIDANSEKPVHTMPLASELIGSIGRMGDKWQMDEDRLSQFYYLEGRFNDRNANYSEEYRNAEFKKLVTFLFNPFEKAVIAPHKRIDMLYFEGLFDGTQSVNTTNNKKSSVSYTYDLGVKKFAAKVAAWGNATSTPIDDIIEVANYCRSKGKTIQKIRMSIATFRNMCKADQIKNQFTLKLGKVEVNNTSILSVDSVNAYIESLLLPKIVIEPDRFATLADGTTINLTRDNRVVFQCAATIFDLMTSDPLEAIDKLPNKTYSIYDDNLVGFWRESSGRFIDYDMWAQPVFTGKNDYVILKTDVTSL